MKKKLLLSGLGGSLFPYLHAQLVSQYDLFYVDSDESLKEFYPGYHFFPAPLVTSAEYPGFIAAIIEREKIDVYIPLIDEEIETAHAIKAGFPHLSLLTPTLDFSKLAMRKDLLMKELKKYGISDVPSWTGDQFEWTGNGPFFVKPISGRGSRGIRKINTPEQLHAYYILEKYSPADVLIQEYVDGEEYTVGALINPYGDLMAISTRKVLKKRGITIRAVTVNDKRIEEVVSQINEHLSPQGPINIQLFITRDGNIKIFEINPRFSTTTVMSYAAGLDEIGLWLKYAEKKYDGELFRPKEKIVLHRRWENVFYEQH